MDAIIGPGKAIKAIELPKHSGHLQHAVDIDAVKKNEGRLRLIYDASQLVIRICPPLPPAIRIPYSMRDIYGHHFEDDKITRQAEKDLVSSWKHLRSSKSSLALLGRDLKWESSANTYSSFLALIPCTLQCMSSGSL